ncbi:hypothetical protein SEVIR_2G080900v4 [Setaria viridis]|uniref:Calponin-homology (CH) domain-containing protein n=1 Tax=Setaria viridis TaxID=4556 RepID=A0A4U6VMW6_SETVI|nr:hypothetical protein SEVIR_2G080900v2 [Setaria viridis]
MVTAQEQEEAAVATAIVEVVMRLHDSGGAGGVGGGEMVGSWRNIDIAWHKAEEAAIRRYEAANWLRRIVGVVCAKDLAEEPSEEEFRLSLRNGIILCNALNKIQPGAVPKVAFFSPPDLYSTAFSTLLFCNSPSVLLPRSLEIEVLCNCQQLVASSNHKLLLIHPKEVGP